MLLSAILNDNNLTYIQKSIITSHMNKRFSNQKIISVNTKNKSMRSNENLMAGKERQKRQIPKHKEFKENSSSMSKKKIDFQTCSKQKITSIKL